MTQAHELAFPSLTLKCFLGSIVEVREDGSVLVETLSGSDETQACVPLVTTDRALTLSPGELVLCAESPLPPLPPIVLGRIGQALNAVQPEHDDVIISNPSDVSEVPATLVLEATEELTLRVGDGSISIRKDGKILIKGKDLVSHAQRVNRIKGGSVSIN